MRNNNKPLVLNLDKIVIGASLEALLCAFYNKIKLLYTRSLQPDEYDIIEDYGLGSNRHDIWSKHMYQLSIAGYVPFANKIKHIRYVDKNTIKVITHEESVITVKYNELYVFDDYNFLDLPPSIKKTNEEVRVIDWFKLVEGSLQGIENKFSRDKFMNEIHIDKKIDSDLCVISYIKDPEIVNYPESLCRIKTESLLSTKKNDIVLEHVKRELYPLGREVYEDFDNVIFSYAEEKVMYQVRRWWAKIDYMKYFRLKLGISNDRDE